MTRERRPSSTFVLLTCALLVAGMAGCGSDEPMIEPDEMAPADSAGVAPDDQAAMTAGDGEPRVYFVEPEMGATVTSPVKLVFEVENFIIEPRGDGAVHHGAGHHHIGIDTLCLEPGIVIPEAAPWVHFGDGSNQIEVQLPPGDHHIVTQVGDGEHRTLDEPGLCAELHVTVVEGESEGESGDEAPTE